MSSAYLPAHWLFMDYFTFATIFVSVVLYGRHGLFGWSAIVATFKQAWDRGLILGRTSVTGYSIRHTLSRSTSTTTYRMIWQLHLPQTLNEERRSLKGVGSQNISFILWFWHATMPDPHSILCPPYRASFHPDKLLCSKIARYFTAVVNKPASTIEKHLPSFMSTWGKVRVAGSGDSIRAASNKSWKEGRNMSYVRVSL